MPFMEIVIPTAVNIPIITNMSMDFVAYGNHTQGFQYTNLVGACTETPEKIGCSATSAWLSTLNEEQKTRVRQALLRLSNELLKMFIQKGKDERDAVEPDAPSVHCSLIEASCDDYIILISLLFVANEACEVLGMLA